MIEIRRATPLHGRTLRLALTDGSVVERDISDLISGPVFERLAADDEYFQRVRVRYGTAVWLGNVDIAPETLIWDGPNPEDESTRRPEPFLRPHRPPR